LAQALQWSGLLFIVLIVLVLQEGVPLLVPDSR